MSGQALYRRWRSQNFDEIISQEHVTRTLQNALRAGRIAHAYLLCGPRGTGKTSTARVLAKAVNCLAEPAERPCNQCPRCQAVSAGRDLDLIEIDAASNRGIDEIRALRDKIAFAPNEGRYRVYVVDEVHMLTTEAFNALLKTLEEPPPHVIFVLATTEPQKIPATILSRCQRFDFRRIPLADLRRKIEHICEAEGIQIQPEAIEAIARRASGSFRDAESLLDQLAAYEGAEITQERVRDLLGGVSTAAVADLVEAWLAGDMASGLQLINRLVDEGADARQLHLEVIEYLRSLLLLQAGGDDKLAGASPEAVGRMRQQAAGLSVGRLVDALRLFGQGDGLARGEVRPQMPLEMAFVQAVLVGAPRGEAAGPGIAATGAAPEARSQAEAEAGNQAAPRGGSQAVAAPRPGSGRRPATSGPSGAQGAGPRPRPQGGPAPARPEASSQAPTASPTRGQPAVPTGGPSLSWLVQQWPVVLQEVRAHDRKLEALLRSSRPVELGGGRALLEAQSSFHRDHIVDDKNRRIVEEVLQKLTGAACRVECTLPGKRPAPASTNEGLDDPVVREDPVIRYAVEDLGAQVSGIQETDSTETANGSDRPA